MHKQVEEKIKKYVDWMNANGIDYRPGNISTMTRAEVDNFSKMVNDLRERAIELLTIGDIYDSIEGCELEDYN